MRQNRKKDSEKIFFVLKSKRKQNTLRRIFRYHEYFNTKTAFSSIGCPFSFRNSVLSAIRRFGVSRATIYRWRKMYDGSLNSLAERPRRPHSPPNQHTPEELKLISDMRRRNPNAGLVVF